MRLNTDDSPLFLGILVLLLFNLSECKRMTISPDREGTVTVSTALPLDQCAVCTVSGENDTQTACHSSLTLVPSEEVTLLFNCSESLNNAFIVQIHRKIECTKDSCSPATGAAQPSLFPEFNTTLTWDLIVSENTVMVLDFPAGINKITESDTCQDGYHYSVITTSTEGEVQTQTYCRNGPVVHLDLLSQATVSLQVPQGGEIDSSVFTASAKPKAKKGRMMSVTPDRNTIVIISKETKESDCTVCVGEAPNPTCHPDRLVLRDARNTSVEFSCPQPQDVFIVEINREIDCTEMTCSGDTVQAGSSLFPDFNRTFTWDLKAPVTRAFQLDFPKTGMRQISNSESCLDEHTYTIVIYRRTGPVTIGTYCRNGPITTIQVLYKGRMSIKVPGDRNLDPIDFKVTVGPDTNMLAVVKVDLPRGLSDTDFISANTFPDQQQMRWDFTVPGMHNYTVRFLDYTEPSCLNKEVTVEYQREGEKVPTKMTLMDPQPVHLQGSFNMSLRNCETNKTQSGLSLNFRVSVMRSGHPVLCNVHLKEKEGLVLHIEKRGSDPYCEMKMDSVVKEKITVVSGTKASLSFLDCPSEDLHLTASKTIACQSLDSSCVKGALLTVPKLDACLPTPLHSLTWNLQVPEHGTVDLLSPTGRLRQSLPGQECNSSVSLHVAESDGSSIGYFCPKGQVHKVQVHSNVTVTATAKNLSRERGPFLNVTFSEGISESIIYTVYPRTGTPALLATPSWPKGMKPYSTVSWIVNLPDQYQADLHFANVSQPKCGQRHTGIKVQTLGSLEEMLSRREDEEAEDKLVVPQSFYLNMSNCLPEEDHFSVLIKITLQKKSKLLLSIILGTVGALLLLMLIVLTVVCLVIRKKKRKMNNSASIYIGKGNIFLTGDGNFPKSRANNESHVYASIDETMVYGHLLRDPSYVSTIQDHFQGQPIDTYRTFTGPIDGVPEITEAAPEPEPEVGPDNDMYRTFLDPSESFLPPRPRTPIGRNDSLAFVDRRMVDNELYTFKSIEDTQPIRLSAADLDPQWEESMVL